MSNSEMAAIPEVRNDVPADERAREIPSGGGEIDLHTDPDVDEPQRAGALGAAAQWRVARSLLRLRAQVDAAAPNRNKRSDGTIGDAAHRRRTSDHNPWVEDGSGMGVVTALDITDDPNGGCDVDRIVNALWTSRDPRIKYIIWNRRIANSSTVGGNAAWAWRPYGGRNPHTNHVHVSVKPDPASYDSEADWDIGVPAVAVAAGRGVAEPLYVTAIAPVEAPVQRAVPILLELDEADRLIGASTARSRFRVNGEGLSVAVLDTGLNAGHIDFDGRVIAGRNFTDDGDGADDTTDRQGHGTNVAGIICAGKDHIGIAPGARVIPLKVLGDLGGGDFRWVRDALQWVIDNRDTHKISVVCMSLGDGGNHANDLAFPNDAIRSRLRTLRAMGVVCCAAAGNDYFTHGSHQGMSYPGIFRETVSVGAVYDANEGSFSYNSGAIALSTAEDRLTPFSQRLHDSVAGEAATDIFAPGAPIRSAGIDGRRGESIQHGTSQATPVVCGVVLLLQHLYSNAFGRLPAADDLVHWLRSSAVRITDGDDEIDNVSHTGLVFRRVDVIAALEAAARSITMAALAAGRMT